MYRKLPPLAALAAFEAAARHKSFTKAADELNLTHSAVSHRIRLLEEHLDTRLFLRMNKQIIPTPKGEVFLKTVKEVLARLQHAASSLRENPRRLLRLSVLPAFASSWLIQRVGDFYAKHPEVDLEIQTTSVVANLSAREADVGVRYVPGIAPGLAGQQLFTDTIFPVASAVYLSAFGKVSKPADLDGAVFLRNRRLPWKPWFDAAALDWPEPTFGPIFSDVGFMMDGAINGQGVALGRSSLVQDALGNGQLVRLTDVSAKSEWNFHVVYLPETAERPEVQAFARWLIEVSRQQSLPQATDAPRAVARAAM